MRLEQFSVLTGALFVPWKGEQPGLVLSVWFNPFLINNWVKVLDEVCLEVFTKKWFFSYTVYVKSHSLTDPVRGVLLVLFYY